MKNKKSIIDFFIKEESALTIIEVLVAVILTAIVMLHGTLFFMASWRLSEESKDYSMILNDVVANLEQAISRATITSNDPGDFVVRTNDRLLRNGNVVVTYRIIKQQMSYHQICFVTATARWRYDTAATQDSDNIINVKSAFFRSSGDVPADVWSV